MRRDVYHMRYYLIPENTLADNNAGEGVTCGRLTWDLARTATLDLRKRGQEDEGSHVGG